MGLGVLVFLKSSGADSSASLYVSCVGVSFEVRLRNSLGWDSGDEYALRAAPLKGPLVSGLKQVPQELVVNVVGVLHLGGLHKSPQQTRATVGGGLLQSKL